MHRYDWSSTLEAISIASIEMKVSIIWQVHNVILGGFNFHRKSEKAFRIKLYDSKTTDTCKFYSYLHVLYI